MRNAGITGQYNIPGIPNIIGSTYNIFAATDSPSNGVLFNPATGENTGINNTSAGNLKIRTININASKANSQYGAQSTVMPASIDFVAGLYLGRAA